MFSVTTQKKVRFIGKNEKVEHALVDLEIMVEVLRATKLRVHIPVFT